ncbi:DASS family sodium-coupled anion symporter [Companilactobacillus sp. HBUAS59699]|uniref:DASS family sodium-coupled anion symporter n=1 Tax=Companilactobacillus sp. HBUAS59699 TaxID=3109358 RepID=UPI002FEF97FA
MKERNKKIIYSILIVAVVLAIWFLPVPTGVKVTGWRTFAIFVGFILGCLLNVAPLAILSIVMMAVLTISQVMPAELVYAGFGNSAVWLIMFAFFVAIGFRTTKLGFRIAYYLIYRFGHSSLALSYVLTICDVIMAPFVPNTNARGAGVLYPITMSLSKSLGSEPDDGTQDKIGSFLLLTSFHQNLIAGSLFFTAMATNPLAISMGKSVFHVSISWLDWFKYTSVPSILALIIVPLVIYVIHKPELKKIPNAQSFAKRELDKMGQMSIKEDIMIGVFVLMIVLWATTQFTKLDNTSIALLGLAILIITGIIGLEDILAEKKVWNIFLWLPPLMAITPYLAQTGVIKWFKDIMQDSVKGMSLTLAFIVLALVYLYIHYFFTSVLVHMQALYIPFATVLVSLGANPTMVIMMFAILTCISPSTTHYGTGTASIYFATGYVTQREWWKVGFIVSLVEFLIFMIIGLGWWKLLGMF